MASCCCIFCPKGTCPPDCPFLEVFPVEAPFKTLQELSETGFKVEFLKECLLKAKTPDEQKIIAEGLMIQRDRFKLMEHIAAGGHLWEAAGVSAGVVIKAAMDGTLAQLLGS